MALLEKLQQILNEKNTKITPENIKAGVTAFGVTGTLDEGIDTSDATATENDLVKNKTAYVNGVKIVGNIRELQNGSTQYNGEDSVRVAGGEVTVGHSSGYDQLVRANATKGYFIKYNTLASAINLTSDKLKKDETILGVTGTYEGIDTSDATATPEDILDEKTAYVNGEKITGNVPSYSSAWIDTGSSDDPDITIDESTVTEVSGNTYKSFRMMGQEIRKHNKFIVDSEVGSNNVIISTKSTNVAKAVGVRPDRIKKDETILGVTGTYEGIDTSDADATDLDIIKDKTAYINGVKVTGRLPIDRNISVDNHYNADTYLKYGPFSSDVYPQVVDSLVVSAKPHFPEHWIQKRVVENGVTSLTITFPASQLLSYMSLTTDKLLAGQKIWYLTGTATSDANATADDIAKDKTAYVNGVKIVGTNEGVTPTGTKSITENGTFDITSFANVDVNVPTTGVMTQEEYDEAVATLDDLLYGNYQEVYSVMNGITDTPTDEYNGVGGTPTQIENTIDTLLGANN